MNKRNLEFLALSFPHYYGRPDTLIDVKYALLFYADSSQDFMTILPSKKLTHSWAMQL